MQGAFDIDESEKQDGDEGVQENIEVSMREHNGYSRICLIAVLVHCK